MAVPLLLNVVFIAAAVLASFSSNCTLDLQSSLIVR